MKSIQMPDAMKLASLWVIWAFVAIGVLGWALFVVLDAFGVKDQAAAWVQALGSIGAILGAIWISNGQARRELDTRAEQHWQYLLRAFSVARVGVITADSLLAALDRRPRDIDDCHVFLKELMQSCADFEMLAFTEMADASFTSTFMVQRRRLKLLVNTTDAYLQGDGGKITRVRRLVGEIDQYHDELRHRLYAFGHRTNRKFVEEAS